MTLRPLWMTVLCVLLPGIASALTLPALPAGMCALDAKVPAQAVVIDYLKQANAGSNEVVASFARCDELAAITQKKASGITHYGTVLRPSLGADIGMDRRAYVAAVATAYTNNPDLAATALASAREVATAGATESGLGTPTAMDASSSGVLFKNDAMVIIGMKQANSISGSTIMVASTAAMTLAGGAPLAVNLYAPASEPQAFKQSSATLQAFVTKLIAANP